ALEKNMELGLLVTGGRIPPSIQKHLEALIVMKRIVQV
ncbi:MAG: phospholipase, partial [Deltaproteobacteria bacterium]